LLLERGALLNNRYRIIEILGQGGMGSVYRAVDENLGVEVAVKDNLFTTEDYARQFRREAVLLATLRHPNLPRVTDHFVLDGQGQYLVMDYIEGEDLRQRMDRIGNIPEEEVIIIGAAICDALTYLSSCDPPIVHRDIKPGNVRITPQGHIYLVDFGLAKDLKSHQTTTTGARAMTPGYSPPEQYGTARTDRRSDIYSLAATLYASLTGVIPEDALSRAVDHIDLTPLRKHNGRVSRRLASVIEKGLDLRPDGRYQTAEDFKLALLNAGPPSQRNIDEFVVPPPPVVANRPLPGNHALVPADVAVKLPRTTGQTPPPFLPEGGIRLPGATQPRGATYASSPLRYWLIILLVLVLTIAAVGFYTVNPAIPQNAFSRLLSSLGRIPAVDTLTPTPEGTISLPGLVGGSSSATPTPSLAPTSTPTNTPIPSPTATLSPSPTSTATSTPEPTNTPTPLPTQVGGGAGQIAYASDIDTTLPQIWLMTPEGQPLRRLTNFAEGACQPTWSPDGKQMIFISPCDGNKEFYRNSGLFLITDVDAQKIDPVLLPYLPGGNFDPAWSPDGQTLMFTSLVDTGSPRLFEMNLEDKSVKSITPLFYRNYQADWAPSGQELAYVDERGFGRIVIRQADGAINDLLKRRPDGVTDLHPTWSPDGTTILFTRYPTPEKPPYLVAVTLATTAQQDQSPLYSGPVPMREARYSPDGLWLAFESWAKAGNHEISIMTTNGSSLRNLTNSPNYDFDAAWRPGS
jgi:eukaryotic-like serine/threonine-protein kinase